MDVQERTDARGARARRARDGVRRLLRRVRRGAADSAARAPAFLETDPLDGLLLDDDVQWWSRPRPVSTSGGATTVFRIAMSDASAALGLRRDGGRIGVRTTRSSSWLHRYPPAGGTCIARAWAGVFNMNADAIRSSGGGVTGSARPVALRDTASCGPRQLAAQWRRSCSTASLRSTCRLTGSGASRTERRFGRSSFSEGGEPPPVHSKASPSRESCSLT